LEWPEYQVVFTLERAGLVLTQLFRGPILSGFVADRTNVTKCVRTSQGIDGIQVPPFNLQIVDR